MSEAMMREDFVVDTDFKAGWALKKIKEIREQRDNAVAWYKKKQKEAEEEADFATANLERMLSEYFKTVPHKKTKTQESYAMPEGKLVMKKQNPEFVRDDKTVIDWLKKNKGENYVKVTESLDWENLKKDTAVFGETVVNGDGEVIPGIEVKERPEKFVVEV